MKKIWQIDRRTFLRGFGAAVGLPMLDIMAPSLAHAQIATPKTRRLVWIYIPHGYIASAAKPDYLMNLLGDMRPNVSVVHGLRNEYPAVSQNGQFHRGTIPERRPDQESRGRADHFRPAHSRRTTRWLEGRDLEHQRGACRSGS